MEKGKNPDEIELTEDDTDGKNWKGILIALLVILIICGLVVIAIVLVTPKNTELNHGEPFTFEDLFSEDFQVKKLQGDWISGSDIFVYRCPESGDVLALSPETNVSRAIMKDSTLRQLETEHYMVSPDLQFILVAYDVQPVFLYSTRAKYAIFSRNSSQQPITFPQNVDGFWKGKKLQYASWAPVGHLLSFVYNNNLYIQSDPFVTPVVISDNKNSNDIISGIPDWLYEEEIFKGTKGHWVSPDGKHVAYIQLNETLVPMQSFVSFGDPNEIYTTTSQIHYPKAGDERENINPTVKLLVADTTSAKTIHKIILPPSELANKDHYITMVQWRDETHIIVAWSNRAQTKSIITVCSVVSADCRENLVENQHRGRGWVTIDTIYLIKKGQYYLIISPQQVGSKGFWKHIAMASASMESNGHKMFLTYGAFDVFDVAGFDNDLNILYFTSTNGDPRERHLFRLQLPKNLDELKSPQENTAECLTCDGPCKFVSTKFSLSSKFYSETCLGPDVPVTTLRSAFLNQDGRVLESNEALRKKLAKKALPKKEYFQIETEDGEKLLGHIYLPPQLNKEHVTQYPLLIHTYAGPDSQLVTEEFKLDWMMYLSATENVITASLDGRGSSGRGNHFLYQVYRKLGSVEVQDQIEAGEYMKKIPFVDKERIAIWGWSYGGFVVSHVLGNKEDTTFRCGIAVAPVTDWRYYDTAYTERYMGRPTSSDNYRGYDNANVSAKAANFKGKGFLLVHGTEDDNVHFQHSAQLMKALTRAGVIFQAQVYPDKNHPLPGQSTTKHLYKTLTKFLQKDCWNGGKPLEAKHHTQEGSQKQKGKS